jgi:hypothetical protein
MMKVRPPQMALSTLKPLVPTCFSSVLALATSLVKVVLILVPSGRTLVFSLIANIKIS